MKITICGSAKFESLWHEYNKHLGLAGHISYSLMTFPSIEGGKTWYTPQEKEILDLCHLAKIEESDAILVLNKDGYVGESTRREILWAAIRRKTIYWLETPSQDNLSSLLPCFGFHISTLIPKHFEFIP